MVEEKNNIKEDLMYYFSIAKPYWPMFVLVMGFITFSYFIEFGQNFIYKTIIDSGTDFAALKITKDDFISTALNLGLIFFITVLVAGLLKFLRLLFLNKLEVDMMKDIKQDIFNHLIDLSHRFHASNRTGSLISRLIRSGKSIESLTDFFTFHGGPLIIKLLIGFIVIAFFDTSSAIVVVGMALIFMGYSIMLLKKQQVANVDKNNQEDFEKAFVSDTFSNIETVKNFGKENKMKNSFEKIITLTSEKWLIFWNYYNTTEAGHVMIIGFGTIAIMYFTISRFILGELTIGSVVFIYTSYIGLTLPLYEFFWGVRRFYEGLADLDAVVKYKKTESEIKDKVNAKKLIVREGKVEFNNLTFGYNLKKNIINNFNLTILPREKVAFVGHSGAGKTTIIKLLYRLYEPQTGKILIDGKNINDVTQESLRNELSIVPQECVLFNDSIYNNILFSNPSASKAMVFDALRAAQLLEFVNSLPLRENTLVGERGIKLSGGEKQRLSIARAILADKKILVLDEATSSLDSKTEYEIRIALEKLMKGRTTIIIAHRLSTIMNADKIIVMKKGGIEQVGTHEELSKKKGIYASLWKLQKTGVLKK
jgi:ATP-binding cassette, subfamily B, heavy metal transporter